MTVQEDVPTATEKTRKRRRSHHTTEVNSERESIRTATAVLMSATPCDCAIPTVASPRTRQRKRATSRGEDKGRLFVTETDCAKPSSETTPAQRTSRTLACLPAGLDRTEDTLCSLLEMGRKCAESCVRTVVSGWGRDMPATETYEQVSARGVSASMRAFIADRSKMMVNFDHLYSLLAPARHLGHGQYASVYMANLHVRGGDHHVAVKQAMTQVRRFTQMKLTEFSPKNNKEQPFHTFALDATDSTMDWFDASLSHREQRVLALGNLLYERNITPHVPIVFANIHFKVPDESSRVLRQDHCTTCGLITIMEYACLGTMKQWAEGQFKGRSDLKSVELELISLYLQVLVCVSAFHHFDVCHNDLYDRNVLVSTHKPGYFCYVLPDGTSLHVPCYGTIGLVADWGMASGRYVGRISDKCSCQLAGTADTSPAAGEFHDMSHDFDVVCTLNRQEKMSFQAAASDVSVRKAVERKSSLRACTSHTTKPIHVMLAKGMPAFSRDILALTMSTRQTWQRFLPRSTWMANVYSAVEKAILNNELSRGVDMCNFIKLITSKEFCQAHDVTYVSDVLDVTYDETLGREQCVDKDGLCQRVFRFDMSRLSDTCVVRSLCDEAHVSSCTSV